MQIRISALKESNKGADVVGFITEKDTVRTVTLRYSDGTADVCNFLLSESKKADETNSITLVLWNDDIDRFRIGDKVSIKNGYVTAWQGKIQLNVGKYGTINIVQ